MHILFWVILIGFLLWLGFYLKRKWIPEQSVNDSIASATDGEPADAEGQTGIVAQLKATILTPLQQVRRGLGRSGAVDSVAQFRAWVPNAFSNDPQLQQWLAALSDEQIGVLLQHLTEFCHDMGFELAWLLEQKLIMNPALQTALTEVVLCYHRASFQAVQLQGEVELFRIYHDYLQDPESRVNRELGEHLFGKFIEAGAATVSIADHLAASKAKRQQQIVATIQQIAMTNPQLFDVTLRSVLMERTLSHMAGATADDPSSTGTGNGTGNGTVNGSSKMPATDTLTA